LKLLAQLKSPAACLLWLCATLAVLAPGAQSAPPPPTVPAVIQRNYDEARHRYETNPDDAQAAWQFARACFDRAEYSRHDTERASLANDGIAACRKALLHQPHLAAAHYWLGMNLAQLARTKMLGALSIVGQMESEWKTAFGLDEKIDYAGPDRFLGLLYRDAPGWPVSLGDAAKARKHLLHAIELCPNLPENHLNLIETYLQWNETTAAQRAMEKLRLLLPAARKEFTGEYWNESWKDWTPRLDKIQAKLNHPAPPSSRQK
jgi:tetratricopeptide (TPR) repeat protein